MPQQSQRGSLSLIIPIILIVVIAGGAGIIYFFTRPGDGPSMNNPSSYVPTANNITHSQPAAGQQDNEAMWDFNGTDWQAHGTPPACPTPLLQSPVDMTKVTAILYPGQTRGGNYKAHGGFRFDTTTDNTITVTTPLDAEVVRGARYLVNGETQYTFDFVAPCGYMYRFGHLLTLTPEFQKLADAFPSAVENDSRTTNINPPLTVRKGDVVATQIGTKAGHNAFVDFGVYNLRQKNNAAKNAQYAAVHDVELDQHAVCWFSLFPTDVTGKILSLPAGDPTSGKKSDYCQ